MPSVVRTIVNCDGDDDEDDHTLWHYLDTVCGDPSVFCTNEMLMDGGEYEHKEGRITCQNCRNGLMKYRKVSLR